MSTDNSKFDLQGLIGNFKTMINPTANTPDPNPGDVVGIMIAELSIMVQQLQAAHVEQGKQLGKINRMFNDLYKHLEEVNLTKAPEAAAEKEE